MAEHLEYQEGLKSNIKAYIRLLCQEAVIHDKIKVKAGAKTKPKTEKRLQDGEESGADASSKRTPPLCLYQEFASQGKHHYVRNFHRCSKEEAERLLKEQRSKTRKKAKVLKKTVFVVEENSTRMDATFPETIVRRLCADNGSDINLMPPDLLASLIEKRANIQVTSFKSIRKFGLAASKSEDEQPLYVACDREVEVTTELHIRYGKSLKLRKLKWYVATHDVDEPLLGRPILEALGLNTKELLEAAYDKYGSSVDADAILPPEDYEGSVARLLSSGLYHSNAADEDDSISDLPEDQWIDLGEDTDAEIQEAFKRLISEARGNGLGFDSQARLQAMLNDYRDVFRIRLGQILPPWLNR